ncbi:MAG: glycosyltransferase family 4 protein [Capsulimonadales bacterium]|nr:glycosyltransferase family 4 protein [Capsulimonadales bacterium]
MRIAHIGTYPPRKCGIATYTQDVVSAVHAKLPTARAIVVAMTVTDEEENYAWPVRHMLPRDEPTAYLRIAAALNATPVDLVSIQHEHGIFGGEDGVYLTRFLEAVRVPVVTTLHTVLPEPSSGQKTAIRDVFARSARVVVLNSKAIPLLQESYGVDTAKVVVIRHGTPDVDPQLRPAIRARLGLRDQIALSTFGLISPGKGLEHAIEAVAQIAHRHPTLHYHILGRTHPGIVRQSGETYRESLQQLAADRGIADRVHFVNQYLNLDELTDWLLGSDIYVTPYLNPNQIVSGTLAYAVAAGKPVLSTPYLHAQEMLDEGRGVLTPFNDPATMAEHLDRMVSDPDWRRTMSRRCWEFGRSTTWEATAERYWQVFSQLLPSERRPIFTAMTSRTAPQTATVRTATL